MVFLSAKETLQKVVIPAKAGIQGFESCGKSIANWIPAFAGMTPVGLLQRFPNDFKSLAHRLSARTGVIGNCKRSWERLNFGGWRRHEIVCSLEGEGAVICSSPPLPNPSPRWGEGIKRLTGCHEGQTRFIK